MRADAQRNRDRLVEAGREVFREQGYDASLDEVARRAGVGPGTLYRHFPTREDLVDAIMQSWVERIDEGVEKSLAQEGGPRSVLLTWFESYVALISLHKGGPAKITCAMGDPASPISSKCQRLTDATERVRVELAGSLRDGVDSVTMNRLVGGVATVADQGSLPEDAVRPLLAVVVDGLLAPA